MNPKIRTSGLDEDPDAPGKLIEHFGWRQPEMYPQSGYQSLDPNEFSNYQNGSQNKTFI